ncbi:hypothetical protein [Sphingomonas bacterium]|uniref:hypothetical protein n=1 Tax=Sphingomonas bacterium TaxID=1895847 RepID=UPI0015766865|nr:hypothetical protein [Sphingomonas bacterium]
MLGIFAVTAMLYQARDPLPRATTAETKAIAADLRVRPDAALTDLPFPVRRDGRILEVGAIRFVDEGDCDRPQCARYRLDAVLPGGHVGVRASRYESGDYWVVGNAGDATAIGGKPVASPSGRYLFVGLRDDLNGESDTGIPNSIALWRSRDMQRVRAVDWPIVTLKAFVAWHGDGCVEFTGQGGGVTLPDKPRPYWLVEEPIDWVLHDTAPSACTAP